MRKVILLFSIVALIVLYVNKPLFQEEVKFKSKEEKILEKEAKDVVGEPIGKGEMNSFLDVWEDYVNSWISNIGVRQLSLTTSTRPDKKMPYLTKAWLNRRGWEVDRFFYVEQRMRAIVKTLEAEDRAQKTIDLLEKQMKYETSGGSIENIKRLIAYQESIINIEKVTKKEKEMVRPRLEEISKLLIGN